MSITVIETNSVRQILDGANEWLEFDDVVRKMDEAGLFPQELASSAVASGKRIYVRRALARMKDKVGFPLYPSVRITDADGKKKRVYKQLSLFEIDDYKAVVNTHVDLSNHHRRMAEGYADRCLQLHQIQLSLWDLEGSKQDLGDEIDDHWTTSPIVTAKPK